MNRLLALAVALLLASSASAQPEETLQPPPEDVPVGFWLSTGPGFSSDGFGGVGAISLRRGEHIFSVRSAATFESFNPFVLAVRLTEDESVGSSETAILYGRVLRETDSMTLTAATGLSLAQSLRQDAPLGIGVPIDVRVLFPASRYLGVGAHGFASINTEYSFGGVALTLLVGRVR